MVDRQPDVIALSYLLRDPSARWDERDDAAMLLGRSDDPAALALLLELARDPAEDELVVASSGESIAEIAVRTGAFERAWLEDLRPEAVAEILPWLTRARPDLLFR